MTPDFTTDDEGKPVVTADGEQIGTVREVDVHTARVEPGPDMSDSIKSRLGWRATETTTYRLDEEYVESISDDEVRIRRL
ncbi:PRC-barrel domain-containing protein [Natrinema sp. 74]|uniref:PRC-barrel domain-containing protein n=1 Tax=Natrinema sp. 74 TaxID=3384159 RepID=UPI0038D38670